MTERLLKFTCGAIESYSRMRYHGCKAHKLNNPGITCIGKEFHSSLQPPYVMVTHMCQLKVAPLCVKNGFPNYDNFSENLLKQTVTFRVLHAATYKDGWIDKISRHPVSEAYVSIDGLVEACAHIGKFAGKFELPRDKNGEYNEFCRAIYFKDYQDQLF